MTPEDRAALLEAGYDPNDPAVQARMIAVERGLALLRARWHDMPGHGHHREGPGATQPAPPTAPTPQTPCAPR